MRKDKGHLKDIMTAVKWRNLELKIEKLTGKAPYSWEGTDC